MLEARVSKFFMLWNLSLQHSSRRHSHLESFVIDKSLNSKFANLAKATELLGGSAANAPIAVLQQLEQRALVGDAKFLDCGDPHGSGAGLQGSSAVVACCTRPNRGGLHFGVWVVVCQLLELLAVLRRDGWCAGGADGFELQLRITHCQISQARELRGFAAGRKLEQPSSSVAVEFFPHRTEYFNGWLRLNLEPFSSAFCERAAQFGQPKINMLPEVWDNA